MAALANTEGGLSTDVLKWYLNDIPEEVNELSDYCFSNCQDLDGDGYYDMLAFRGVFETNN